MNLSNSDTNNSIIHIIEYIKNNYNKNHSVQQYAKVCNLEKYYFIKIFCKHTGDTPLLFRTKIRIEKAKELLMKTEMTNEQISELVGYSNAYYFSRIFKNHTKLSPTEFKKQYK